MVSKFLASWSLSLLILCSSAGHVTVSVCVLQKAHRVTFTAKARKLHIHVTEVLFTGSSIFSPVEIYPSSIQVDRGCGYWKDLHQGGMEPDKRCGDSPFYKRSVGRPASSADCHTLQTIAASTSSLGV